jgi:hypothetical protein
MQDVLQMVQSVAARGVDAQESRDDLRSKCRFDVQRAQSDTSVTRKLF